MSVLFSARNLNKSFGGVLAVRDVSFDIPAACVFAIIGPNGAGKSTMLNLISGVYQPDAVSLGFRGADMTGMPAHRRVRLGIGHPGKERVHGHVLSDFGKADAEWLEPLLDAIADGTPGLAVELRGGGDGNRFMTRVALKLKPPVKDATVKEKKEPLSPDGETEK